MHGWIVLDKAVGMTSTQAVGAIKRLFSCKRAGHAGTLDPLASGCLPIALGEATKTVPFVMDGRKVYRFTVRWGEERDTDDADGRVVATSDARPDRAAIEALLPRYTGTIAQVPPQYLRDQDRRRARLRSRPRRRDGRSRRPGRSRSTALSWLTCPTPTTPSSRPSAAKAPMSGRWPATSAGRSDVWDISRRYGARRSAHSAENDMISLEQLTAMCHRAAAGEASLADALLPVETALDDIPALAVSRADAARLQRGQAVLLRGRDAPIFRGTVYVTVSGQLVALAEVDRGEIVPKRVFNLAGLVGSRRLQKGH